MRKSRGRKPSKVTQRKKYYAYLIKIIPKTFFGSISIVSILYLSIYGVTANDTSTETPSVRAPQFYEGFTPITSPKINYDNNITNYAIQLQSDSVTSNATANSNVTVTVLNNVGNGNISNNLTTNLTNLVTNATNSTKTFIKSNDSFSVIDYYYDQLKHVTNRLQNAISETEIAFYAEQQKQILSSISTHAVPVKLNKAPTVSYANASQTTVSKSSFTDLNFTKFNETSTKAAIKNWFYSIFTLDYWIDILYDTCNEILKQIYLTKTKLYHNICSFLSHTINLNKFLKQSFQILWSFLRTFLYLLIRQPIVLLFFILLCILIINLLMFIGLGNIFRIIYRILYPIIYTLLIILYYIGTSLSYTFTYV